MKDLLTSILKPTLKPKELAQSLRVWRSYQQSKLLQWSGSGYAEIVENIAASTNRYVVYLALEKDPFLEFSLRQCFSKLQGQWGLQIFTLADHQYWLYSIVKNWLNVRVNILDEQIVQPFTRDNLLKQVEFWHQVKGQVTLFIDQETILRSGAIDSFLQFDYVAPLWKDNIVSPWCEFGNGALSIRKPDVMREICQTCNTNAWMIPSESVFFSTMLRIENHRYQLASMDVAARFATESVVAGESLALHNCWQFIPAEQLSELLVECP